jgi:hypothetical protein
MAATGQVYAAKSFVAVFDSDTRDFAKQSLAIA